MHWPQSRSWSLTLSLAESIWVLVGDCLPTSGWLYRGRLNLGFIEARTGRLCVTAFTLETHTGVSVGSLLLDSPAVWPWASSLISLCLISPAVKWRHRGLPHGVVRGIQPANTHEGLAYSYHLMSIRYYYFYLIITKLALTHQMPSVSQNLCQVRDTSDLHRIPLTGPRGRENVSPILQRKRARLRDLAKTILLAERGGKI